MIPIVILCGGLGTRVQQEYKGIPKSLIPINGIPFLDIQIMSLVKSGFKSFYLSTGYLGELIEDHISKNSMYKNITIKIIRDSSHALGTGGALKNVAKHISSPFFVIYGDSYLDINYKKMFKTYKLNQGPMISIYKNYNLFDKSNCWFEGDILRYSKEHSEIFDYIDYGVSIYENCYFESYHDSFDLSLLQENYSKIGKLQFYKNKKRFYEIGSIQGIKELSQFLKHLLISGD